MTLLLALIAASVAFAEPDTPAPDDASAPPIVPVVELGPVEAGPSSTVSADQVADAPPAPPPHTDARWGLGGSIGGGGIFGLLGQVNLENGAWLEIGLHLRVAFLEEPLEPLAAPMLTVGGLYELNTRRTRPAVFAVAGLNLPLNGYHDSLIAAGIAARFWSYERRSSSTIAFGPGVLPYRRIPTTRLGPPFLLYLRFSTTFQRADARIGQRTSRR